MAVIIVKWRQRNENENGEMSCENVKEMGRQRHRVAPKKHAWRSASSKWRGSAENGNG
jgi:hypothetical protein